MQATCLCFKMASIEKMRFSSWWLFKVRMRIVNEDNNDKTKVTGQPDYSRYGSRTEEIEDHE